jgi:hypothetical protein
MLVESSTVSVMDTLSSAYLKPGQSGSYLVSLIFIVIALQLTQNEVRGIPRGSSSNPQLDSGCDVVMRKSPAASFNDKAKRWDIDELELPRHLSRIHPEPGGTA